MKHTNVPKQDSKQKGKGNTGTSGAKVTAVKKEQSGKDAGKQKGGKYKMDFIKKDNFDTMGQKFNITEIKELQVKYVLNCIEGIFKNRFLYITTHKDG